MKSAAILVPFLVAASAAICDAQTILVEERFIDGERSTDDPPSSLLWTYGAHHATAGFASLDASSGALLWDHTDAGSNSFSAIWAHFTPGTSPFTLAIGETLEFRFDLLFSGGSFGTSNAAFRWALFDSNNSRITTDFAGASAPGISNGTVFSGWRGYIGQTALNTIGTVGNTLVTRERTGSGNALFDSAQYADVPGSAVDEPLVASDTVYAGSLTLTREASGMSVQASIAGTTTNLSLDGTPVTEFDTIAFFTVDSHTHNITVDNVVVEVVPEPSAAVLLGAAVLPFAARRRRS